GARALRRHRRQPRQRRRARGHPRRGPRPARRGVLSRYAAKLPPMDEEDDREDGDESEALAAPVPAPRENPELQGHAHAEQTLLRAFAADRLPNGLLIAGPHGIGKATLAFRFARFLLAQRATAAQGLFAPATPGALALPPTDPIFRRVASGGHADLMVVER